MTEGSTKPKSDLGVRTASGIAMMLVSGVVIWIGGWTFKLFVLLLAAGLIGEWAKLVFLFVQSAIQRSLWIAAGLIYIGIAVWTLLRLRDQYLAIAIYPVAVVIATDVGAYFAGRTVGGPKIAPRISPSKTWSGLIGGMVLAAIISAISTEWIVLDDSYQVALMGIFIVVGAILAVCAQAGDFLESWMKRRAGVKDSGTLIPGHGGLLDRMDGLLSVLFVYGTAAYLWRSLA